MLGVQERLPPASPSPAEGVLGARGGAQGQHNPTAMFLLPSRFLPFPPAALQVELWMGLHRILWMKGTNLISFSCFWLLQPQNWWVLPQQRGFTWAKMFTEKGKCWLHLMTSKAGKTARTWTDNPVDYIPSSLKTLCVISDQNLSKALVSLHQIYDLIQTRTSVDDPQDLGGNWWVGPQQGWEAWNLQPERQEMTQKPNYFCRDYLFTWQFKSWVLST